MEYRNTWIHATGEGLSCLLRLLQGMIHHSCSFVSGGGHGAMNASRTAPVFRKHKTTQNISCKQNGNRVSVQYPIKRYKTKIISSTKFLWSKLLEIINNGRQKESDVTPFFLWKMFQFLLSDAKAFLQCYTSKPFISETWTILIFFKFSLNCTDDLLLLSVQPQGGSKSFGVEPASVSEACVQKRISITGWESIHVQNNFNRVCCEKTLQLKKIIFVCQLESCACRYQEGSMASLLFNAGQLIRMVHNVCVRDKKTWIFSSNETLFCHLSAHFLRWYTKQ